MKRIGLPLASCRSVFDHQHSGGGEEGARTVKGGATTTVAGGTGAPAFVPVITKLTFHWRDGQGHFECLALAPTSAAAGNPGVGSSIPTSCT